MPGTDTPETPEEGAEVEIPRDQLWEMEELVVAGGEERTLGHFVRQFGQDEQGEIYVLANRRGVPEGDTGVVMKLVAPEEGETITPGETPEEGTPEDGTPTEGTPEAGTPDEETPGDGTPEDGTPTPEE